VATEPTGSITILEDSRLVYGGFVRVGVTSARVAGKPSTYHLTIACSQGGEVVWDDEVYWGRGGTTVFQWKLGDDPIFQEDWVSGAADGIITLTWTGKGGLVVLDTQAFHVSD
jgi:hypothetical protein